MKVNPPFFRSRKTITIKNESAKIPGIAAAQEIGKGGSEEKIMRDRGRKRRRRARRRGRRR